MKERQQVEQKEQDGLGRAADEEDMGASPAGPVEEDDWPAEDERWDDDSDGEGRLAYV